MEIIILGNERMIGKMTCMVKDFSAPQYRLCERGFKEGVRGWI